MATALCPSRDDLVAYARGDASAVEAEAILHHVKHCPGCQAVLGTLGNGQMVSTQAGPEPGVRPPSAPRDHLPRVSGFELLAPRGSGRYGPVYRARHLATGRLVALRLLAVERASTAQLVRLRAELDMAAALRDPNIVEVVAVGETDDQPFVAMEWLDSPSLAQRLATGPLPPLEAARLVESLARAVHAGHVRGVLHRNLRPGSVLFDRDGKSKVADFGLAALSGPDGNDYQAPEQRAPGADVGPAADVWALGALLYACLTGQPPAQAPQPPSKHRRDVPRGLEAICLHCLRTSPRERYTSAQALADALHDFIEGPVAPTSRPAAYIGEPVPAAPRREHPILVALLAMVFLATSVAAGWFAIQADRRAAGGKEGPKPGPVSPPGTVADKIGSAEEDARAQEAKAKAHEAKEREQAARRQEDLRTARQRMEEGQHQAEIGKVLPGLGTMIEALRIAPRDETTANFRRAICTAIAAWARNLSAERPSKPPKVAAGPPLFGVAVLSPDGRHVLFGREGYGRLADGDGTPQGDPVGDGDIELLAFSGDGRLALTAPAESSRGGMPLLRLLDCQTGRLAAAPLRCPQPPRAVALSNDGSALAIGCKSTVLLVDTTTMTTRKVLQERAPVLRLLFSPDASRLAVGTAGAGASAGLRLWDTASGKPAGDIQRVGGWHGQSVLFYLPAQKVFVALDAEHHLQAHDLLTGKRTEVALPSEKVKLVAQRPDGQGLATWGDGELIQWDAAGKKVGSGLAGARGVTALAYSSDGRVFAAATEDGARQWDTATGLPLGPSLPHTTPVLDLVFSADGRTLITASAGGVLRTWPMPEPAPDDPELLGRWFQAVSGGEASPDLARRWPAGAAALAQGKIRANHADQDDARARDAEDAGDMAAAVQYLRELASARAEDWHVLARLGQALAASKDYTGAAQAYDRAVKLGGDPVLDGHAHAAMVESIRGRPDVALWHLDQLIAGRPNSWRAYAQRAGIRGRLGDKTGRDEDQAKALRKGADRWFTAELADDRARQGRWSQTVQLLAIAEASGQPDSSIEQRLAVASLAAGDQRGYRQAANRMLSSAGADPDAVWSAASVCALGPGVEAAALPLAEQLLPRQNAEEALLGGQPERRGERLVTLGALLYRAGRYREAIARLEKGMTPDSGKVPALFLAMANQRLDNAGAARKWLAQAQAIQPQEHANSFWSDTAAAVLAAEAKALVRPDGKTERP